MSKNIIEYTSDLYPKRLKLIQNPPVRLYVEGNVENLKQIGIAVIGSRTNTQYGEKMCKRFVKELVEYNIIIISGLANGIDSIAHKTCLKNSGKTVAVLPSGLENIYPEKNRELAKEIIKNGGTIISEYESNTKADSKKFLERNRIIAGLGIGTLVVEGGYRSGTSVTAKYTLENQKTVFCIPSSLENPKGIITNELIKKGAKLVTTTKDILENYKEITFCKRKTESKDILFDIPLELRKIYININDTPQDVNEISRKTGTTIEETIYKLTILQLNDKILELPGQRFIRNKQ